MPGQDYVPREDEAFRTWAEALANNISSDPAKWMLTPGQAASILGAVNLFVAALAVASNETTRTKLTVAAKDDARSICESMCRQYCMLIKENDGISDEDKIAVGVRPPNPSREPVECPQTSPLLNIVANTPGSMTTTFADSMTPNKRARPFGAAGLQLYLAVTTEADAPLTSAQLYKLCTRNPVAIEFAQADDGKVATLYGRWYSTRGDVGPWSLPVSMRIAA